MKLEGKEAELSLLNLRMQQLIQGYIFFSIQNARICKQDKGQEYRV